MLTRTGVPLGLVTSINGSARYMVQITGLASHAGTTPMGTRRDAAAAAAEFMVALEETAGSLADCVATVGQLEVVNGSTNVVPGHVRLSLDLRARPTNNVTNWLNNDVAVGIYLRQARLGYSVEQTLLASAAPSDVGLAGAWQRAIESTGLPAHPCQRRRSRRHEITRGDAQAMLFVRGENLGISHNPWNPAPATTCNWAASLYPPVGSTGC